MNAFLLNGMHCRTQGCATVALPFWVPIAQGVAHHAECAVAIFRRRGDVERVGAHAVADDLGVDPRVPRERVIERLEHQDAGVPPLSQIEPRVQDALYMQRLQPALRAYLEKLREDAYIDIKPGYVDTGASPNQTRPVETATTDARAKQLKKKKKLGLF